MNDEELLRRLRDPEDEFVERKKTFHPTQVLEAVVAFANSTSDRPGVIFIGVAPDGTISPVGDADKLARVDIDSLCKERCYPPIKYQAVALSLPEGAVLAVVIPPSQKRPHFAGPAFIREGSRTTKASEQLFEELVASRNTKAGAILRMKGKTVTAHALEKQIGAMIFESHFNHEYEARVEACDAHSVTLLLVASDRLVSEPLEWVTIARDDKKHRPLLVIRRPR